MRIFKYRRKTVLFAGSYGHHYNRRRLNKAIIHGAKAGLLGLMPGNSSLGKRVAQLIKQVKAGMRTHHLVMKDYDFSGFEATKHRFGLIVTMMNARHEQKYEKLFASPKQYRVTVLSQGADKLLDADSLDGPDIGGQGIDYVVYYPTGKAVVCYEYSSLDKAIDDSDEWYDKNRTSLKPGVLRILCITGAPGNRKHRLQKELLDYGSRHGHPEWDVRANNKPNQIDLKRSGWVSCIVSRKEALIMKQALHKQVLILNCTVPARHWWVPFHRLVKRGMTHQGAKKALQDYYHKDYGINDYYSDIPSISIPILTNNLKNERRSLHYLFHGATDC